MSTTAPNTVILTSVPPRTVRLVDNIDVGNEYQADCIRSWNSLGFPMISVNPQSEVMDVRTAHPELTVVPVDDRAMPAWSSRPLLELNDLLDAALLTNAEVIILINADITLGDASSIPQRIGQVVQGHALIGQRMELETMDATTGPVCTAGFDMFVLHRSDLNKFRTTIPLFVGAPWWDYHMVVQMILNGISVKFIDPQHVRHLAHSGGWDVAVWNALGVGFGRELLDRMRGFEKTNRSESMDRSFARLKEFDLRVRRRHRPAYKAVIREAMGHSRGELDTDQLQDFAKLLVAFAHEEWAIVDRSR